MQSDLRDGLRRQISAFKGIERGGWKVGLTSGPNRDGMGIGFRPFGHIAKSRIFESGVELSLADAGDIGVENELCFHFDKDLSKSPTESELIACIEAISPGFELNERRLPATVSDADRLADNLSQFGVVHGRKVRDWQSVDLDSMVVTLFRDCIEAEVVAAQGHIDNHIESLLKLAGTLSEFDLQIKAGDVVITGAFGRSRVTEVSRWRGYFNNGVGEVEVNWV